MLAAVEGLDRGLTQGFHTGGSMAVVTDARLDIRKALTEPAAAAAAARSRITQADVAVEDL